MKSFQLISITLLTCGITACAGHQRNHDGQPPVNEELLTTITPSGLKIFTYTVSKDGSEHEGQGKSDGGGPSRSRGGSSKGDGSGGSFHNDKFMKKIEQDLLVKLAETDFCREGYIKLGSSIDRKEAYIRGECVESANKEDRERFMSAY